MDSSSRLKLNCTLTAHKKWAFFCQKKFNFCQTNDISFLNKYVHSDNKPQVPS